MKPPAPAARSVLKTVGIVVAVLVGAAVAVAAVIGIGLLFWLGLRGLVIVVARAIVDGIKDAVDGNG